MLFNCKVTVFFPAFRNKARLCLSVNGLSDKFASVKTLSVMTYTELWRQLAPAVGEGEAKAIVRALLDDLFGMSLTDIVCGGVEHLGTADEERLFGAMQRLRDGEPVQYVTGSAPFMRRTFHVESGVLIPRPETERLCQMAIEAAKETASPAVLDIGTGSGCIATTIALELPGAKVEAWDISPRALLIASGNARRLGATVAFRQQDALHAPADDSLFDVIVSNPPYICQREAAGMERNVLEHEPPEALFVPDDDPLLFYRAIARYAAHALRPGGSLLFEINSLYARQTEELLAQEGFKEISTERDIFGKERDVKGKRIKR